jgi:hypothetical protein
MAFSIKIRGVPVRDDAACWSADILFWWDMRLLREKYPVREIVGRDLYRDYVIIMTPDEALDWNLRFGESYRAARERPDERDTAAIDGLTRTLQSTRDATRWIVVEQYEWESGR